MKKSNAQSYINMASAFIMFAGGLAIATMYPGDLTEAYRWGIALFVTFYFVLRMAQSIMAIRRNNRGENGGLHELVRDQDKRV